MALNSEPAPVARRTVVGRLTLGEVLWLLACLVGAVLAVIVLVSKVTPADPPHLHLLAWAVFGLGVGGAAREVL